MKCLPEQRKRQFHLSLRRLVGEMNVACWPQNKMLWTRGRKVVLTKIYLHRGLRAPILGLNIPNLARIPFEGPRIRKSRRKKMKKKNGKKRKHNENFASKIGPTVTNFRRKTLKFWQNIVCLYRI